MSIFTSLLAIIATARLLPQDREDRTVYTILAKPVPALRICRGQTRRRPLAPRHQHPRDERAVLRSCSICANRRAVAETDAADVICATRSTFGAALQSRARLCLYGQPSPGHRRHLSEGLPARLAHAFHFDFRNHEHFHRSWSRCLSISSATCRRRRASSGCKSKAPAGSVGLFSAPSRCSFRIFSFSIFRTRSSLEPRSRWRFS